MRKILFSTLGSTDPIASMHDGATLHIIRKYKPEKVYLYMSKEICDFEDKDARYSYCIEHLREMLGIDFDVEYIKKPELVDVHVFDFFLAEFREIIEGIREPNAQIILNVSSGTPAMKSALQILSAMMEINLLPVQVSTPNKAINRREDLIGEYDVALQWELNMDNTPDMIDRCTESKIDNIVIETKRRIIINHIEAYDYVAAFQVAQTIPEFVNEDALKLIQAGAARLKLDFSTCSKVLNEVGYDMHPIKQSGQMPTFEYLMVLQIKVIREEYADFLRGISPLFFELLERIIINAGFPLDDYSKKEKNRARMWIKSKTVTNTLFEGVNDKKQGDSVVFTSDYCRLIMNMAEKKMIASELADLVESIRNSEENMRNPVAHTITYVTDELIKTTVGKNANGIFKELKKLVQYAGINISPEDSKTYETLNDEIRRRLDV